MTPSPFKGIFKIVSLISWYLADTHPIDQKRSMVPYILIPHMTSLSPPLPLLWENVFCAALSYIFCFPYIFVLLTANARPQQWPFVLLKVAKLLMNLAEGYYVSTNMTWSSTLIIDLYSKLSNKINGLYYILFWITHPTR